LSYGRPYAGSDESGSFQVVLETGWNVAM